MVIDKYISDCILKASTYKGILRIGIFGSFARAEQTDDSDIDILYDYHYIDNDNNGLADTFEFLDILESDLVKQLGNRKIDFVSYQAITDSDNLAIKQSVLNEVIWIYEQA